MIAAAQSPLSNNHPIQRPKSNRKPLQPKNSPIISNKISSKQKNWIEISPLFDESNKENAHPIYNSTPLNNNKEGFFIPIESSLADELSAIREKIERLRIDKDKTEKMLIERSMLLDSQMKEIHHRSEVQKLLEIEVDRLYRLNEIRLACQRVSPLRSLRDKEQERKEKNKPVQ